MLPKVLEAVAGAVPVMIDSSFRRGSQVIKALSLGARFVCLGRPFNYAASIAGEAGVKKAVSLLGSEIERNMALLGITDLEDLNTDLLRGH